MNLLQKIRHSIFPPVHPLPAGVYAYQSPADAPEHYRLHLRLDADGSGILIVNASTVAHLNPTAAEMAYYLVQGTDEEKAVAEIASRYDVRKEIIRRDYHELSEKLHAFIHTPDLDPVTFFDFEREEPYSAAQSAPYRIDCALTYRLQDENAKLLAPLKRVDRELTCEEWEKILQKAWDAGVPHVVFTGGEPTLRPDLIDLVAFAEKLGMVSGVITDGLRLGEPRYLHNLLQAGLDHLMILVDAQESACWEGIRDALAEDIALTAHLTLDAHNQAQFDATLARLAQMGVKNISLSAMSPSLSQLLLEKRQAVADHHMRLVWDLPVPYSHFHPVALELAEQSAAEGEAAHGAGQAWLYVEPDGDVLRGQGLYQETLGNLLRDSWETIWAAAKA
jgi:pyruvate-formate lyase-activating enzyme